MFKLMGTIVVPSHLLASRVIMAVVIDCYFILVTPFAKISLKSI